MKTEVKRLFVISVLTGMLLTLLVPGCGQPSPEATSELGDNTPEEPPADETPPSISPISLDLSISNAPALNEIVKLTFNVSSGIDASNTTAQIKLPEGANLVNGNLTWQGDLKAGEPVSFSAEIVFREAGEWAIEGVARRVIDETNSWGAIDIIYLTVGVDRGEFGWGPPSPVPIEQEEPGDVPGVPSSQEEPPTEDLPEPPAISVNGTVEDVGQHNSITVTGTWKYWTKSGDYRVNPDEKVPAEVFLVELSRDDGIHRLPRGW